MQVFGTRLRADANAKAVEILQAADRLLRTDPAATLEQIAQEAGSSRATIYRRFPTRGDLLVALSRWAVGRIVAALEDAGIGQDPPQDALLQATRNVIEVKTGLEYARTLSPADDPVVAAYQDRMHHLSFQLLTECQDAGLIATDADLGWVQTVFYALVHEASINGSTGANETTPDQMAARVIDTLLHGAAPQSPRAST